MTAIIAAMTTWGQKVVFREKLKIHPGIVWVSYNKIPHNKSLLLVSGVDKSIFVIPGCILRDLTLCAGYK